MGGQARALELRVGEEGNLAVGRRQDGSVAAPDVRLDVAVRSPEDVERLVDLVRRLLERNAQLEHALGSRVVIEQAKGVLAERLRTDPDSAFAILRRAARSNRLRIHDLARAVVSEPHTPAVIEEATSA